jgi:flagellar biosynthesis protein FliR
MVSDAKLIFQTLKVLGEYLLFKWGYLTAEYEDFPSNKRQIAIFNIC